MKSSGLVDRLRAARTARWALDALAPARDSIEPVAGSALSAAGLLRRGEPRRAARLLRGLFPGRGGSANALDPGAVAGDLSVLLDALVVPTNASARFEGPGAGGIQALLGARLRSAEVNPSVVVLADFVGRVPARKRRERLVAAATGGATVVLIELMWPEGREVVADGAKRRLRRREWWAREARHAGLHIAAELRPRMGSWACLGLTEAPPRPSPRVRVTREPLRVHVDDDLSRSTSFSWITAALSLAMRDAGAQVSITPTALSPALGEVRGELRGLMRPAPDDRHASIGWTHFWQEYRRTLVAPVTLALFAVNYQFDSADHGPLDPWLASVLGSGMGLAPISTFCRDVLVTAGADPARCHVVPMGRTADPPEHGSRPRIHGAAGLPILHVTNASDLERHGTAEAIAAFRGLVGAGYRATLVIRDYGSGSPALARAVADLRGEGLDVRYWPVFYAELDLLRSMRAFDILLAPFRGEGFGIKLLDAMAAGLAVVGPFFGGPRDFLDESVAFRVDHRLVPMRSGYDAERLCFGRTPLWAEPDPGSLLTSLVAAAKDPAELERRRTAAALRAEGYSWAHSADTILAAVRSSLAARR